MRAGNLRHRVTVLDRSEVADGHGGFTQQQTTVCEIWASVQPLGGKELNRAQQVDPRMSHRVMLRYRTDILTRHILVYHDPRRGDRELSIVAPPMDVGERHLAIELRCSEAV
jgi:SPP1 family predicted phage head-tail adaptor